MNQFELDMLLTQSGLTMAQLVSILRTDPDLKILTRFTPQDVFIEGVPENPAVGVVLDTETTGLDTETARIIELGMVKFLYDSQTGEIYRVLGTFSKFKDPGMPIPEEVTRVTHITDDMVKGARISDEEVAAFVSDVELVIAHNAAYDRPIMEREFPVFESFPWVCTLREVPWSEAGISGGRLEYIAAHFGFFYDAHRAETDCLATIECLRPAVAELAGTPLKRLLQAKVTKGFKVYALDSPFSTKDALKSRGYRWHSGEAGQEKAWGVVVESQEALDAELAWLKDNVYRGRPFRAGLDSLDAFVRFSARRNQMPPVFVKA